MGYFLFFCAIATVLLMSNPLAAAPLKNYKVTVEQPDGTILEILLSGDEFYNYAHDEAGFIIVRNPKTGFFVYSHNVSGRVAATEYIVGTVDPYSVGLVPGILDDKEVIKDIYNNHRYRTRRQTTRPGDRTTGILNIITIFIRFSDESEFTELTSTAEAIFNANQAGDVSMYNYFQEVSYNQLEINTYFYPVTTGDTIISYQDPNPRNYYQKQSESNPDGYDPEDEDASTLREHTLLQNAIKAIAIQIPQSLEIDINGDDQVDGVNFIVSGDPDEWSDLLWPHMWTLHSLEEFIYGKRVMDYTFNFANEILGEQKVSTVCHETFHLLGAPDLYHYNQDNISPSGMWDLMEQNQSPPQHMLIYMKKRYGGWLSNIPEITSPGIYSLNPVTSLDNNAYKIPSPNSSTEYFVVEYRQKSGTFESSIPGSGLIVYRIDTALDGQGNADGPPDELYIFRPGGSPGSEVVDNGVIWSAFLSPNYGRTIFNSTTVAYPFLQDGSAGGIIIRNVSEPRNTIGFEIEFQNSCTQDCDDKDCGNDGCGGNCGSCTEVQACDLEGQCVDAPTACPLEDLGGRLGTPLVIGTTVGAVDNFDPVCSSPDAVDVTYKWTVPESGEYRFDTYGSSYDTIINLFNACGGDDNGCYDDTPSEAIAGEVTGGYTFYIMIDGYDGAAGQYALNITRLDCSAQCDAKACGPDGCGGYCGVCDTGSNCDENGQCIPEAPDGDEDAEPETEVEVECETAETDLFDGDEDPEEDGEIEGETIETDLADGDEEFEEAAEAETEEPESEVEEECVPWDCIYLFFDCGIHADGCGGTIDCGGCGSGYTCVQGICLPETTDGDVEFELEVEEEECTPDTCLTAGIECGSDWDDGCGGSLDCGSCDQGYFCDDFGICTPEPVDGDFESEAECVPYTCLTAGIECDSDWDDGCGGTLDCGDCDAGYYCDFDGFCQPEALDGDFEEEGECMPDTCLSAGIECDYGWDDGCGGELNCGTCITGFYCDDYGQCQFESVDGDTPVEIDGDDTISDDTSKGDGGSSGGLCRQSDSFSMTLLLLLLPMLVLTRRRVKL